MSYAKAMKHCHNHRKDRYYQQCGCGYSLNDWAYCVIDSETKERLSEDCKTRKEADSAYWTLRNQFPTRYFEIVDVHKGRPIIYSA